MIFGMLNPGKKLTRHKILQICPPHLSDVALRNRKESQCRMSAGVFVLQYESEAVEQGHTMLQMPPVKKAWEVGDTAKSHVLATDDIDMWDPESDSSYVFTDITYGLPRRVSGSLVILTLLSA